MPRTKGLQALEARIGAIINEAASAIAAAVRQDMADELQQLLAGKSFSARFGGASNGISRRGGAGQKRNVPKKCIYPGCSNASKGPRWSFLCDTHKNIAKAERKKLLLQWKSSQEGGDSASDGASTGARKASRGRKKSAPAAAKAAA